MPKKRNEKTKNKIIRITGDDWGKVWLTIYTKKNGMYDSVATYKFNNDFIEGVDLEVGVPKGKRTEYSKITRI